jgi:uncharacterized coiled-coil protein SlyX
MFKSKLKLKKIFIFLLLILSPQFTFAQEEKIDAIADQLQIITQDLKTLEKAVYKTADITNSSLSNSSDGLNEEILTRHLLKLNEIEEEFRKLTNRFEEVNFKLDKLSSRVTKYNLMLNFVFLTWKQEKLQILQNYSHLMKFKVNKKLLKLNYQVQINHKI